MSALGVPRFLSWPPHLLPVWLIANVLRRDEWQSLQDAFPKRKTLQLDTDAIREARVASLDRWLAQVLLLNKPEVDHCVTNFLELQLPKHEQDRWQADRADFDRARLG